MINKRLNDLSCNKEEFDKAKQSYSQALEAGPTRKGEQGDNDPGAHGF